MPFNRASNAVGLMALHEMSILVTSDPFGGRGHLRLQVKVESANRSPFKVLIDGSLAKEPK